MAKAGNIDMLAINIACIIHMAKTGRSYWWLLVVLGLPVVRLEDIRAESAAESAAAIRSVLAGERGPRRDIVIANAGAALYVAGVARDLRPEARKRHAERKAGRFAVYSSGEPRRLYVG